MNFNKSHKNLTEILNLPELKVISYQQFSDIGIFLKTQSISDEKICPRCGTPSHRLHQNHRHVVKDLPWGNSPVFLEINRRQFKCKKCKKPFSETFSFIGLRRNYTNRLAHQTVKEVLNSNISAVAKKGIVTTEEIERMLKDAASKFVREPVGLKRLGIDEIALVKGKGSYCAVLIDLDKSELIAILPGRTQSDIKSTLLKWGESILNQIEEVSIDLWKSYKSLIIELIPNAQVVADRFHVMKQINQELDRERKTENYQLKSSLKSDNKSQKAKIKQKLNCLKKSKYALIKNESDLTETQKNKLNEVQNVFPKLKKMHQLKEEIRDIFERGNNSVATLLKLTEWLLSAQQFFPKSYKTIIRWFAEIIAYFDRRTTNGIVEGINNKIKLIKRSGYGFKNFENFKMRCLLNWHFI